MAFLMRKIRDMNESLNYFWIFFTLKVESGIVLRHKGGAGCTLNDIGTHLV